MCRVQAATGFLRMAYALPLTAEGAVYAWTWRRRKIKSEWLTVFRAKVETG